MGPGRTPIGPGRAPAPALLRVERRGRGRGETARGPRPRRSGGGGFPFRASWRCRASSRCRASFCAARQRCKVQRASGGYGGAGEQKSANNRAARGSLPDTPGPGEPGADGPGSGASNRGPRSTKRARGPGVSGREPHAARLFSPPLRRSVRRRAALRRPRRGGPGVPGRPGLRARSRASGAVLSCDEGERAEERGGKEEWGRGVGEGRGVREKRGTWGGREEWGRGAGPKARSPGHSGASAARPPECSAPADATAERRRK